MFKRILIANRGEIAVRVARGLRDLGIASVAVFSDADRSAPHVRAADEAYHIGPAAASESYLDIDKVIGVALRCGAEAIHPGYGFLSENADFAKAVEKAGLIWIGPPPAAMAMLGDKLSARRVAASADVPVVPGSPPLTSDEQAYAEAERIGFPLVVKAAAGGGGKGMRSVDDAAGLTSALRAARSEGKVSFGDDTIYLERRVDRPRHIEVQILGDQHGNIVHLGERECSVQRRHQKVVEESPSPAVDEALRSQLGEAAVRAARAAGYTNAGTCEFLLGGDGSFYFLEVNARLQVEHPVTELRTGLDLVALQVAIAAGEPLPFGQDEIRTRGHAIEVRIYAEDPDRGYLPTPGTVAFLREPAGPGVRVDSGIAVGFQVTPDYDPILAKLIVAGADRPQAIARMRRALGEYRIGGMITNLGLHRRILDDPRFIAGDYDTSFLEGLAAAPAIEPETVRVAALAAALVRGRAQSQISAKQAGAKSRWKQAARVAMLRGGG